MKSLDDGKVDMQKRFAGIVLCIIVALLMIGCPQEESPGPVAGPLIPTQARDPKPSLLLQETVPLQRFELAGQALSVWRQYSSRKPTLLLLSNDPMLLRTPDEVWPEVARVVALGDVAALKRAVTTEGSSPLLLPAMTVDAALRSGWFGSLVWSLPLTDLVQGLDLANLSKQLLDNRLLNDQEVATLNLSNHVIKGQVRDTPLLMGALSHLPEISEPVILHIDQSYFQKLYKNEIATPLIPLVIETLKILRDKKIPVLAVTFDYGNLAERISLDVRFLGEIIAELVVRPESLDEPLLKNWQRQGDILYLNNFFQKGKVMEAALAMESEAPDSAWVKFALYRAAAGNQQGNEALRYLAEAVDRDNAYALEYLSLSKMAYDKGRPDEAMRMLTLAGKALPDNPFIKLDMAQLALNMEDKKTALHLVEPLQQLEWSTVYFPEMPSYLASFAAFLKGEDVPAPQKSTNDPRRQRILK